MFNAFIIQPDSKNLIFFLVPLSADYFNILFFLPFHYQDQVPNSQECVFVYFFKYLNIEFLYQTWLLKIKLISVVKFFVVVIPVKFTQQVDHGY